jgi:hypothetical protein
LSGAVKDLTPIIDDPYQDEIHDDYNLYAELACLPVVTALIQVLLRQNDPIEDIMEFMVTSPDLDGYIPKRLTSKGFRHDIDIMETLVDLYLAPALAEYEKQNS